MLKHVAAALLLATAMPVVAQSPAPAAAPAQAARSIAATPPKLIVAISVGIGMFIATIGLVDAGFVRRVPDAAMTTVPVQLGTGGSISSWPTLVFILGLFICAFMVVRGVRGGLFIGIVITTVIAMVVERLTGAGSSADNPGG